MMMMKLLAIFAVLFLAVSGICQAPDHTGISKDNGTPGISRHSQKKDQHLADAPDHVETVCNPEGLAKSQGVTSQPSEDIEIQRKLSQFTKYLVWVGGLQALILGLTIVAIWGQTRANKDTSRAWIITPPANWKPEILATSIGTAYLNVFDVIFQNAGHTPAHLLEFALVYRNLSKDEWERLPPEPKYEFVPMDGLLLVPKDSIGKRATLIPSAILREEEVLSIKNADRLLYAYGFVKYTDAFRKVHEMRFGYLYYFPQGGRGSIEESSFQRSGPPAYNRAT